MEIEAGMCVFRCRVTQKDGSILVAYSQQTVKDYQGILDERKELQQRHDGCVRIDIHHYMGKLW